MGIGLCCRILRGLRVRRVFRSLERQPFVSVVEYNFEVVEDSISLLIVLQYLRTSDRKYSLHSRLSQTINLSPVNFIFGVSGSNLSRSRHARRSCLQFRTPFGLGADIRRGGIGHSSLMLLPQSSRSKT
jgi:hypothetical protein